MIAYQLEFAFQAEFPFVHSGGIFPPHKAGGKIPAARAATSRIGRVEPKSKGRPRIPKSILDDSLLASRMPPRSEAASGPPDPEDLSRSKGALRGKNSPVPKF